MTEDKYITSGSLHSKKESPKQNDDHNRHLALQFGMVIYNDLSSFRISKELIKKTPYTFAKKNFILPLQEDKETVLVVIADPLHLEALEELRLILNKTIKAAYCPKDVILASINDCYNLEHGEASEMLAHLTRGDERVEAEIEIYDLLDNSQHQAPIVKVINLILTEAIQQGASDIHFEPSENGLRVRYRIDGVLQARHSPAPDQQAQLLTRIKVMSRLDIAEHRLPQDGRLKLKMGRREIDFRVSTVPVSGGERIVMRILDKGNVILGLDKIGMPSNCYKDFKKLIAVPEGIILVTGPTGSGKTTTLYSAICEMYNDETNIMTIEDPVEYNLKGIAQIGVHPKIKLDFATGLRHILRQDPDIIMIGEIRDKETAEIAIQASLTGHLVLSTLHTNDAPSAITRLVDMGIEPYLLSSCIIGVLAQRLVRKICSHCKTFYTPTDQEIQNIGLKRENLSEGHLFHGTGCQACYGSGYKGRHGIYELMLVNHAVKQQIVKSPDAVELRRVALHAGMMSLLSHGSMLTKQGITTVAEVLRTTRGIEEG
ncbi:Type II secretion system protein E [Neochlamydia sp. EPS4]|uniref:type II secretion system ATPase GspE n=1 Tax=Neochlamydia sp. EPS4 TaxID=1478175 RepID=UPI00058339A8|nr:type II secretion system ATPase GspE [Neochlamydia sp. EPS4]KIC75210.1 Type II secretion system protein E [Neochlamydia sp. EPS4]